MVNEPKQVKVILGRFQPFTLGHLKIATTTHLNGPDSEQSKVLREQPDLSVIERQPTVVLVISTPASKTDIKHPFDDILMRREFDIVKRNYREIEDILYVTSADITSWGEMLKQNGYQASVWITGSDRFAEYKKMAMNVPEYETKNRNDRDIADAFTKSFYVEQLSRTETDFVSQISATKVREAIMNDDKAQYERMMPKGTVGLFDDFREAIMNVEKRLSKYISRKMKPLSSYIKESMVTEGGHVFQGGSDPILKDDIQPTLDRWLKEIKRLFPKVWRYFDNPQTLGSVGKKDVSGDIDIAIDEAGLQNPEDWNLDIREINRLYDMFRRRARTSSPEQLMKRAVIKGICDYINDNSNVIIANDKSSGNGTMFTQTAQIDHTTGKENGKTVQIDCNFGQVEWLKFAYYSDSYAGNVKGLHRTQLMLHMFTYKNYIFNHVNGVKNKLTQEVVATTPDEAIELLNKLYGFKLTEDILSNYHKLQEFLKDNLNSTDLSNIYDIYLKTLDSTRCDIPEDLQPYWVENQDRLGLTGKFLPKYSNLYPLKK